LSADHARFIPRNTVRLNRLCEEISASSTFSAADIKGVLQALGDRIVHHLYEGNDLDIEGLGHFTASLRCRQPENGGKLTARHVEFNTVKFRCSAELRKRLHTMRFEPVPKDERYAGLPTEERRQNIMQHLGREGVIQSATCMAINACSRYAALQDLEALSAEGRIARIGTGKTVMYRSVEGAH
ncbi:MAG: HU family DNA-binding protein, partial [Tannerellaceae bacterium]|nr:HU family DNA-binding protein [Tannerellaceae bacterium]